MFEAINNKKISFEDQVTTSKYAASMGGSQVYLEEGESMSLEDMFKSIAIASANDASVAVSEYIAGSTNKFVEMMNQKAKELNLKILILKMLLAYMIIIIIHAPMILP